MNIFDVFMDAEEAAALAGARADSPRLRR